ncbi:unnamed protein product [Brachionus calyciflorus]|uniref:Uncharacterized protein n=1 Tax=Brachionus calyciflorus TaxID=104777 RepID=A0A813MG21_9BILA|nr:unnamed protein product [Brachionus calyciflorus]
MNDDKITLPCGYTTTYQNIINQPDNFECVVCKDHFVNKQECLSVKRNVLVMKQQEAMNEYIKLKMLKEDFDRLSLDRENTLKESFSSIKNKVDLRREELKKKIDDYYFHILNEIENIQKETFATQMKKDIKIENLGLNPISLNLDQKDKIKRMDEYLSDLDKRSQNLNKLISELKIGENYELTKPNDDFKIDDFFGKIEFQIREEKLDEKSFSVDNSNIKLFFDKSLETGLNSIRDFELTFDNKLLIFEHDSIYLYKDSECQRKYFSENNNKICVINNELFAVGCKGYIGIREIYSGNFYKIIETNEKCFNILKCLSKDKLICLSDYTTISIWNYKTGKLIVQFTEEKTISALDELLGGYLCLAIESIIKIIDPDFSNVPKILTGHTRKVTCLKSLNAKGNLASGSEDTNIKIWDFQSISCKKTLIGHTSMVNCLEKLKNGFLISSDRFEVRLWNIHFGVCIQRISIYKATIRVNSENYIALCHIPNNQKCMSILKYE